MTGTRLSTADLDPRRRRALFRAWHRGTREMDLLMGRFADTLLPDISDADLDRFEALIEVPDRDLFDWIAGKTPVPGNYASPLFERLVAFQREGGAAMVLD